jgi:hypothetical protein
MGSAWIVNEVFKLDFSSLLAFMHYFTMNYKELFPAPQFLIVVAGYRNFCPDFRLRSDINLKIIENDRFC